jgi:hypothetical protein
VGLAVFLLPVSALAQALEWDQERVIELAEQLTQELAAASAAASEAPAQQTVMQQRSRDAAVRQIERVRSDADALLKKLRAGLGRDATATYFYLVLERAGEVIEIAGDAVPRKDPIAHWRAAGETAREMARYYPKP